MQLYSFFNSSTSYRVRIALALKGLDYQVVPVNLRQGEQLRPADRQRNPMGALPTLVDADGRRFSQSLAIIDYLDAVQPEPRLIPLDPLHRAQALELALLVACDIHPLNNVRVLKYPDPGPRHRRRGPPALVRALGRRGPGGGGDPAEPTPSRRLLRRHRSGHRRVLPGAATGQRPAHGLCPGALPGVARTGGALPGARSLPARQPRAPARLPAGLTRCPVENNNKKDTPMTTRIRASLLALPLLLPPFQAIAALPGMNLGQTSFLDGKALPGTLFQQFVNIYEADDFMDANGHRRPLDNRLRTLLATSHFAHISQHQLFGAYYGAEILVPVLLADPDFEPHAGSANGLGNLIVSPFILQWPQTELFGRPYWQRLNLAFQLPTGRYDRHRAINPGSNHWSFNPHYALTWEFAEGWEASARLQYLLPGKNRDPAPPLADDYLQPGQAFHANYSVSLALDAHWRLGLSGYSLRQITNERVDGHDRPDSRERVDAIGPALMFGWGKSRLFLNAYHEYGARNRSEGSRLILRYSQVF